MQRVLLIPPPPVTHRPAARADRPAALMPRSRSRALALLTGLAFLAVSGQLVHLALQAAPQSAARLSMMNASATKSFARPDIVDRNGRLLATDVQVPSLYADAGLIQDPDEVTEKLITLFPDLDAHGLRLSLADKSKRFIWIRRGLSPPTAQTVHNLGLPGLLFVDELKRTYPAGRLAGHTLGRVDADNRGLAGIERYIDDVIGVDLVYGATLSGRAAVHVSMDLAVTHALEDELQAAMRRYRAPGAAGLVLDIHTGEVLASVSLPGVDPLLADEVGDVARADKIAGGTYELGSVFKMITIAMALDSGLSPDALVDTTQPLTAGRYTIKDLHPLDRPMSVSDVFLRSSNVGAGLLALNAGPERQKAFLNKLGLLSRAPSELGPGLAPQLPAEFGRTEQITVSYGHGLAVSPLQFASAAASLVNGGVRVVPTFIRNIAGDAGDGVSAAERAVSTATSAKLNALMRRNVTDPTGTGQRADVPGYRVGGKTGTAERAAAGGYTDTSVISSFIGAFPMDAPKYLTLVMIFEPQATAQTGGEITAGRNAAPTTARIIDRIAPLLGVEAKL